MIKTNEEIKKTVVSQLKKLIQDIENDQTSNNYSFNWELLEQVQRTPDLLERDVMFSVKRTEYHRVKNES